MNRCEEVLKQSVNKGLKIEKDELYHSDTYLGNEYDEGLKHWKYIKKYKNSKGKTVYVYANKETHDKIKAYKNMSDDQKKLAEESEIKAWKHMRKAETSVRERGLKQSEYYNKWSDENRARSEQLIKDNDVKKKIKSVSTAISEIHKDAVKRGTDFIEKIMKKFN